MIRRYEALLYGILVGSYVVELLVPSYEVCTFAAFFASSWTMRCVRRETFFPFFFSSRQKAENPQAVKVPRRSVWALSLNQANSPAVTYFFFFYASKNRKAFLQPFFVLLDRDHFPSTPPPRPPGPLTERNADESRVRGVVCTSQQPLTARRAERVNKKGKRKLAREQATRGPKSFRVARKKRKYTFTLREDGCSTQAPRGRFPTLVLPGALQP